MPTVFTRRSCPLTDNHPQFLSREDAAKYLNVSVKWLAQGGRFKVPHYKFGHNVRYERTELQSWAKQQRVVASRNASLAFGL